MKPFGTLRSRAIPLAEPNIDTDQIIPAQYVNALGEVALRDACFKRRREADPGFVFNREEMRDRSILLAGPNFGCGSSREAAAWALGAWGIRALIAPSFNLTFHGNCLQNGLLPVTVKPEVHALLSAEDVFEIDLQAGRVSAGKLSFAIELEAFARELLLRGIDELQYLIDRRDAIAAYERR